MNGGLVENSISWNCSIFRNRATPGIIRYLWYTKAQRRSCFCQMCWVLFERNQNYSRTLVHGYHIEKQTEFLLVLQNLVLSCGCSTLLINRPLASQEINTNYFQLFFIDSPEYKPKSGLNVIKYTGKNGSNEICLAVWKIKPLCLLTIS